MRGQFITFEGGEGTGKSTQVQALAARLQQRLGLSVVVTREPGGSPGAEIIRHVILSGAAKPFGPEAEAILFAAARDDHVRTTIAPALARGEWVICDRFFDSTRVYQGILGQVNDRLLSGLQRVTIGNLKPDLTLVLDLPVEIGLSRARKRRGQGSADRFESEDDAFHRTLREAFLDLAFRDPDRCAVIDAQGTPDAVSERVWRVVSEKLPLTRTTTETAAAQ